MPVPNPSLDQLLRKAIEQTRLLRLRYRNKDRIVEPHDYGEHNGVIKLLTYQVGGSSSRPLPNWRWMETNRISDAELLDQTFPGGRPTASGKHHKWDKLFLRVKPAVPGAEISRSASDNASLPKAQHTTFDAHALNGSGDRSRLWVSLLEQLTCIDRLDLLTALPWATMISCGHLLRPHRAWCASCYGEKAFPAESVYERLLWAFQLVTVCPVHGRRLDTVCPSCSQTQRVLSAKLRPGYCSRCQCWLGRAGVANTSGGHLTGHLRVAEMVGQLLAASPSLPAGFGSNVFRENVRKASGVRDVRDWVRRAAIPRMDSLVSLSLSCEIPLLRLLTERIESDNNTEPKHSPKAHHRVADGSSRSHCGPLWRPSFLRLCARSLTGLDIEASRRCSGGTR